MPFHGQDAWRRHPLFNNLWKDPLPGIRPAIVVFSVYMAGEYAYKRWNYYQHHAKSNGYSHQGEYTGKLEKNANLNW